MNTVNNQRFQETDRRIQEAMLQLIQEKEVNKVTVNDICTRCGINRSTFYAHFVDIYDLLGKLQMEIYQDVADSFKDINIDPSEYLSIEYIVIILDHVRRHQLFYRAYFSKGLDDLQRNAGIVQERFISPYMRSLGIASERQINYQFRFFWAGFIEVVRIWVFDGCPETPEDLVKIIAMSVRGFPEKEKNK